MADERRILRQRQADRARELDRLDSPDRSRSGSPRELVQIIQETTVPTAVPKVFACKSVGIDAAETEGATPTFTTSGDNFKVIVLGPGVPVAGNRLIARSIGGRWVAQGGASCVAPSTPLAIRSPNYLGATKFPFDWDAASQSWIACLIFPNGPTGIKPDCISTTPASFDPTVTTAAVYRMGTDCRITRQAARCGVAPFSSGIRGVSCPPWPQSGSNLFGPAGPFPTGDPAYVNAEWTETQEVAIQVFSLSPVSLQAVFGGMTAFIGDVIQIVDP